MNKLSARQKQTDRSTNLNVTKEKPTHSLSVKPINQLQMITKFKQDLQRRKEVIQKLYQKSVPNQIYSFPRYNYFFDDRDLDNESTSSQSSLSDIELQYDLKKQNKKNKKGQTNTGNLFSSDLKILCKTQSNYQSINPVSFKNNKEGSAKKVLKKKTDSNYDSKNPKAQKIEKEKSKEKDFLFQSCKKNLTGQRSLGKSGNIIMSTVHKNYSTNKPKDKSLHISFRAAQNIEKEDRSLKIKKHKSKDKINNLSVIINDQGTHDQGLTLKTHKKHIRNNTEY